MYSSLKKTCWKFFFFSKKILILRINCSDKYLRLGRSAEEKSNGFYSVLYGNMKSISTCFSGIPGAFSNDDGPCTTMTMNILLFEQNKCRSIIGSFK